METATLHLAIPIHCDGTLAWADPAWEGLPTTYAHSLSAARKKLKPLWETEIREGLRALQECSRGTLIICRDGTALLCTYHAHCGWGYHILSAGRPYPSGSYGPDTREECEAQAREHASQCYGGIAWEMGW